MRAIAGMSVIVTGAGSGLGAGTARFFAAHGAMVTICGRRADKIEAVAAEIGSACRAVAGDITSEADRTAIIDAALSHGGGIDVLVNAAGNMLRGPIEALDQAALLDLFNTNVIGAMLLTGQAVPHLAERQGSVIFFGSVHTRRAFPGASAYAATKGALEALTRVLAAELGPRQIRVNCIVPGAVPTEINQRAGLYDDAAAAERMQALGPLHALGRIGTALEIAEAVAHLACAEWTTGAVLDVDGGLGLGVSNF